MIYDLSAVLSKCLVELMCSLELADDNEINLDFSIRLMESVSSELNFLPPEELLKIKLVAEKLANGSSSHQKREYFENFVDYLGID